MQLVIAAPSSFADLEALLGHFNLAEGPGVMTCRHWLSEYYHAEPVG